MSGINIAPARNSIPGTDYEVRGTKEGTTVFVGKDGKEISQEQFLEKVATKEISLGANSLTFLGPWVGPDALDSLRSNSGYQATPAQLLAKLGVSDELMGDLYTFMAVIEKMLKDQKKAMTDVSHLEQTLQLEFMKQGAAEDMAAARVRAVMGFVSAALTVVSGFASGYGAIKGMGMSEGAELFSKKWDSVSTGLSGIAKSSDTAGGLAAAGHEQNSKEREISSKKMEQMQGETRDGLDVLREMLGKVRELLQTMNEVSKGAPRA